MDLFAGNFESFDDGKTTEEMDQGASWSDFANFDNAFEESNGPPPPESDDPFKTGSTTSNIDEIFGEVKDHAVLLEELENPRVLSKMSSSGSRSSSDEDDPIQEQDESNSDPS